LCSDFLETLEPIKELFLRQVVDISRTDRVEEEERAWVNDV